MEIIIFVRTSKKKEYIPPHTLPFFSFSKVFSNAIKSDKLQELAESDEHEVVKQLQEFYGDYFAYNPYTASLNMDRMLNSKGNNFENNLMRSIEGLSSLLLSLRKQPRVRKSAKSELADIVKKIYNF